MAATDTSSGPPAQTVPADLDRSKVKVYDFKRPDKFSKEQIKTVAFMHETFARQATTALSSMLRCLAHVRVQLVDQLTYEEFIRSVPNPTTLAVVSMEPLKGSAVMMIDPALTSATLDRLFGGAGKPLANNRELTDIEWAIMEGAITRLLGCLRVAWNVILDLQPKLAGIETKPQFAQIVHPHEMIVLVVLEARIGEATGMICLALPFLTIEPIIPRLSAENYFGPAKPRAAPNAAAASLPVTVEVCYEGERMSLGALTRLKRGTLVSVPHYGDGAAFLQAGGVRILDLAARPRAAGTTVYAVNDQRAGRDLALLGAAGQVAAQLKQDPLRETLQEFTASVSAGMKSMEGKMSDLLKRQEELVDQLVFQSPEKDAALPGQKAEKARPFGFLTISYCETLATFLALEHPQLIALVLSYLEPGLAACVLERLPQEIQADITQRVCTIERTSPEVLREVERVLDKKMAAISSADYVPAGGIAAAVEILNVGTRGLEKFVVESLEKSNPDLAEEIKKRMFVFEDIVLLDRQTVSRVLAEVSEDDLLLSLKATEQKVEDTVWECIAPARVPVLKERLAKMGRARLSDVDAAQQRIVGVIRRMDEEGLIVVARPGETVD